MNADDDRKARIWGPGGPCPRSGHKGVSWNRTAGKWQARATSRRTIHLGFHTTVAAAAAAVAAYKALFEP